LIAKSTAYPTCDRLDQRNRLFSAPAEKAKPTTTFLRIFSKNQSRRNMADRNSGVARERIRRRRHTAKEHGPDPVDLHVGGQLRLARELTGLTQTEVGRALEMSFQVIQKYEQGEIRVSASRLFQLGRLLRKSPDYFFEGLTATDGAGIGVPERSDIELVRAFRTIQSDELKQLLVRLARDIAEKHGNALATPHN
jgi:transcriptional regulator with XRE-family HTH domain